MSSSDHAAYVCEREDIFTRLDDAEWFAEFMLSQYALACKPAGLRPHIAAALLSEAHTFWQKDLRRVSHMEYDGGPLDHFKRCGHLCYWLRRSRPLVDFENADVSELPARDTKESALREFLLQYGNEYVAFEVGFRICRYFEAKRSDAGAMLALLSRTQTEYEKNIKVYRPTFSKITSFTIGQIYIRSVCYMLKEKNVSPHAIHMVYRSLFFEIRRLS